ncbi:MAG: tetratricopeptide repeat protein [Candidatus Ratteibacteria bacterium]|jgi:tetratricopeptide (TPR) repeat protein
MKRFALWVGLIVFFAITLPAFGQQTNANLVSPTAEEYFNKGTEFYEADNYSEAVAAFEKALELKTDYLEAEYNLAITYWTQKNYPKAISTLESLAKKTPTTDIGKKATDDLQKLKAFTAPVVVLKKTTEAEETNEEVNGKRKSVPELLADLKFGLLAKRISALDQLKKAETDEAIEALIASASNEHEKLVVRSSAVQNLAQIKNPKALAMVDQALAGDFPKEEKFEFLVALANQNTPEAFKVILKYWFLKKWPVEMETSGTEITRKEWPPELADPRMWTLTKALGKEESLPLFLFAWPGITETTYSTIPENQRDYIFYYNLMTGFLKGDLSVAVLVQRLKEDYPKNNPALTQSAPGGSESPSPGFTSPILKSSQSAPGVTGKSSPQKNQGWTVEDEVKLRVEMVEVLGGVAGESQGPFLEYLALNDPKTAVRVISSEAFKSLNIRVARSKENYEKGLKLLESGNFNEASSLFEQALKENYDSPYRKNIKKNLISTGIQFLAKGNKVRAASLLNPLYQLLSGGLAQKITDATSNTDTNQEMVKKMIRDQLAALEIPSASIKAQDIQNIYDLGLELGIIKKPELFPGAM